MSSQIPNEPLENILGLAMGMTVHVLDNEGVRDRDDKFEEIPVFNLVG